MANPIPDLRAVDGTLRFGIDQPAGAWPTAPRLKSYEAAGFSFVQVSMPPRSLLREPEMVSAHAGALRAMLDLTGLGLVLHAPEDIMAGDRDADACLRGALDYAVTAGAPVIVYHGRRPAPGAAGAQTRLAAEKRSLGRIARRAASLGVTLAVENLAPVYPGSARVGDDPAATLELVRELDSPAVGICLDIGHANVVAGLAGRDLVEMIQPLLAETVLFHLHDNFGGSVTDRSGSLEPLRLDLHLVPGAGTVPWRKLAPVLANHGAPLQLEVRAPARPEPGTLAVVLGEVIGLSGSVRA